MHVWNLSRLIDNITHFNKISSKQRGIQDDYSMISEQINNDGYVEVQLLPIGTNIEDLDKYAVASGCGDGTVHANIMPYKEDEDEVDVSISDFIVFRNQLQATKNGGIGGNASGTTGTLNRRRSGRQQQMSHKLRLLKSGPYPNSNAHELHKEDYTKLDKMLESPEEVQFNDKSNRRSKFIAKRQWSNKRAMKALSY